MENYYQVLGVNITASLEEIKRRYFFLVKVYHPDRYVDPDDKRQAEEELKKVNRAYQVLGDEEMRKEYDSSNGFSSSTKTQHQRTKTSPSESSYVNEATASAANKKSQINICQGCGSITYTCPATYRKNIGMLFLRRYRKASGELCADCHESLFWNAFLTNLFLGWWGIISFCINPFLIIMNLFNYIRSWKIRSFSTPPKRTSDWKLVIALGVLSIYPLIQVINIISVPQQSAPIVIKSSPTSTKVVSTPTLTYTQRMDKVKTQNAEYVATSNRTTSGNSTTSGQSYESRSNCTLWSDVTLADVGKTMCVYGTARNSYYDDKRNAYIFLFSAEPHTMYFIKHGNGRWDDKDGKCIKVTGEISQYSQTPYIEIREDYIYLCN